MGSSSNIHPDDWRGLIQLAGDGVDGANRLVEQMHRTIAGAAPPIGAAVTAPTRGITGLVYRSIRGVNAVVGAAVNTLAAPIARRLPVADSTVVREQWRATLNGIVGDHLEASGNPLAIPMAFRQRGQTLSLETAALVQAIPSPKRRLLISAHGLCMNDLQWVPRHGGASIPDRLGRGLGWTALDLHYNTGRPVADNGSDLSRRLETLIEQWPHTVDELVFIGHSMGGLVIRRALEHGLRSGLAWPTRVRGVAFLGTPHAGSPLERAGHRLDRVLNFSPYTAPFNRLGRARSAGITDLRHGLPPDVGQLDGLDCLTVAATARPALARLGGVLGDGLVPVDSALGHHRDAQQALPIGDDKRIIVPDVGHLGLLHAPRVYRLLGRWLR